MVDNMNESVVDTNALYKIEYGLYVVTCFDGNKDNGLIVNTVMQVTGSPCKIAVAINKQNYSYEVIKRTGALNVNCLSESAPFKVMEAFGFRSGRDVNKFEGCSPKRTPNGLVVLPKYINAYFSLKVESCIDLGSHGLFICEVTLANTVNEEQSMTYSYYHANVKPKPQASKKKGYVCKICGYVHEGELTDDFVCPWCKHGASDFEPIE